MGCNRSLIFRGMTELPPLETCQLRRALLANAAFSTITGTLLLFEPRVVAPLLGIPPVGLRGVGAALIVFAAGLVWQATRRQLHLSLALATVGADLLWVVGSVPVLALGWVPSFEGGLLVTGVAAIVAGMAITQWSGIARAIRAPDPERGTDHHYRVSVVLPHSAAALWPIVSDLEGIAEHAPHLASASVEGPVGPGAVRRCSDTKGVCWREEVTGWHDGEGLEMRFATEDERFPFPMAPMFGGWRVQPEGEGCSRVTLWWSFTTRPAWAAPLIVAAMDVGARRDMEAVMGSMATTAAEAMA